MAITLTILLVGPFSVYFAVKMGRYAYLAAGALFAEVQKRKNQTP